MLRVHWFAPLFFIALLVIFSMNGGEAASGLLTAEDVLALPATPADERLSYGDEPLEFGDLRLPAGDGPFPIAVILHGGCWISEIATLDLMSPFASALTQDGIATWNLEYRRLGDPGGGWPGTFADVAKGVDHLRVLAQDHSLDLDRVIVIGHSAGGHLALWAAGRHRLPPDSPLYVSDPLPVRGVIDLAGPGDLDAFDQDKVRACGGDIVTTLLGAAPDENPERLRQGSPAELLPLGVKQILITGKLDPIVPLRFAHAYQERATRNGDSVDDRAIEGAGHFDVIAPGTSAWSEVESAARSLLIAP